MVNLPANDLLTAEEKAAITADLVQWFADTEMTVTVTYHSTGAQVPNSETGVVVETGGIDASNIKALKVAPRHDEMEQMKTEKATEVWLLQESDLTAVSITPKTNDLLVVGSVNKYVKYYTDPQPGIHYRVFTGDVGNG